MQQPNIYHETETAKEEGSEKLQKLIERLENKELTLSYSSIKQFQKSPRHFISYKLKEFKPTDAMIFGDLIDTLLTAEDEVEDKFLLLPSECSFGSHAGVTAYCNALDIPTMDGEKLPARKVWVQSHLDKETKRIVDKGQLEHARRIAEKVWTNNASRWVLENTTETQKPIEFEAFGWNWRGYQDCFGDGLLVADLKLTADADFRKFSREIERLGYDTQAAVYTIGPGIDLPFFNVGYDRSGHVCVIEQSQGYVQNAWDRIERTMEYFERCIALNEWNKSYDFWAGRSGIYRL